MNNLLRRLFPALLLLTLAVPSQAQFGLTPPDAGPPPPLPAGTRAPALSTSTINGHGTLDMARLRGRVVLVDFWATWCGPCQMATPTLQYLHKTYGKRGLVVLGMNADTPDTQRAVRPFLSHYHVTYPVAVLTRANARSAMAYHVEYFPSQYLIDRRGVVRWSQSGYAPDEGRVLSALVRKLLAERG